MWLLSQPTTPLPAYIEKLRNPYSTKKKKKNYDCSGRKNKNKTHVFTTNSCYQTHIHHWVDTGVSITMP